MKDKVSVGLIGLGAVGLEAFFKLTEIQEIKRIYVANRSPERSSWAKNEALSKKDISIVEYDGLEAMLETDIQIIAADANKTKSPIREKNLPKNLELIDYIASFQRNYAGTTLIVTNPVDELCYAYASLSGTDPKKVIGLNELDRKRAISILKEFLSGYGKIDDVDALTIGPHSPDVVPILKQINNLPPEAFRAITLDFREIWRQKIGDYGPMQMGLNKSTAPSTADSVRDVVKAIINEKDVVCCSTYTGLKGIDPSLEERLNLFIGLPVVFKDGIAQPRLDLFNFDDYTWDYFLEGFGSIEKNLLPRIKNNELNLIRESDIKVSRGYHRPNIQIKDTKFDPGLRIFASSRNRLYSCNPNKPNQPETIYETDSKIGTFVYDQDSKDFFLGEYGKIVRFNTQDGVKDTYQSKDLTTIRKIIYHKGLEDDILLGLSTSKGINVWDMHKKKVIYEISQIGLNGMGFSEKEDNKTIYTIGSNLLSIDMDSDDGVMILSGLSGGDIFKSGDSLYAVSGNTLYLIDDKNMIKENKIPFDLLGASHLFNLEKYDDTISFISSSNYPYVVRMDSEPVVYERRHKNGISSLLAFDRFLVAGDKKTNYPVQISIWHLGNTKTEYEILTGFGDRSITSLAYARDPDT